jgi:diguanylate cyclase
MGRKSAQVSKRKKQTGGPMPWKLLLWAAVAGLVFGLIGIGEPLENALRMTRNSARWHKAGGDITLVTIDDHALQQIGRWPWPRRYHAELIDKLTAAGAKRIFFDVLFETQSDPIDDNLLAAAIRRSGTVVLPVAGKSGPNGILQPGPPPLDLLSRYAKVGSIGVDYNYQNAVWRLPYSVNSGGQSVPSYAASLANRLGTGQFIPDYSIDPRSIPTIGAANILSAHFDPRLIKGKDVIVGTNSEVIGDQYYLPGFGKMGGVYIHIIGAETLKTGKPVDFGWLPAVLLAFGAAVYALSRATPVRQNLVLGGTAGVLLIAPIFLDARLISADTAPALFMTVTVWCALGWRMIRKRGLVNPISNLPNLNAFHANRDGKTQALIAARVLNYEEILATLPPNSERQLIEQIVSRLTVGAPNRVLYQGDGGIFTWFESPDHPFVNHLEALYALFRNPARVAAMSIDLSVAFGVEVGSGRSLANRLASALVAADEAAHDGLKWKYYDPGTLEQASWKLSMLSQLDEAIDRGEVWVAYQPKLDLSSRRITGAEALARWTHPEKGPIAATEFVAAAEQHNRIGKLTDFVLEKAVAAAAQLNQRAGEFDVAVNLSARLLTDKGFTLRLSALLARHGLAPHHLTLELTETAALAGSGEGLDMLARLRELGVRISIDDYGTGLSTLDYLKKIPANEIKIDQSFVKGIVDNRSDRLMVQSTIGLAHSLDRKVVAEGVEQRETLDLLIEMGCDVAQGFAVGRPMSLESLNKRMTSDRKRSAA